MSNRYIILQGKTGTSGSTGTIGTTPLNYNSGIINTSSSVDFVLPIGTVNFSNTGNEKKLSFNSQNGTLQLGEINNTNWNNTNQGIASLNIGVNNFNSGNYSIIHGSFNSITGTNCILTSLNSIIANSNSCLLFNGSNNSIYNSNSTILFNSSATNSSNSFGFGNAQINHNNCFVWSDTTLKTSVTHNSVLFYAPNNFNFDNYLQITRGVVNPLTTTNIGNPTLQFNNLFLNSNIYIQPYNANSLAITASTNTITFDTLNSNLYISKQIIPFSNTVSLSMNNLYLSSGSSFVINTTTYMTLNTSSITLFTNLLPLNINLNLGTSTNKFSNIFTNDIYCNDSIILRKNTAQSFTIANTEYPITWSVALVGNKITPANLTWTSGDSTKLVNTSGYTKRVYVTLQAWIDSSVTNNQLALYCNRYNSSNTLIKQYNPISIRTVGPGGIVNQNTTIFTAHGIIELNSGDYITGNVRASLGGSHIIQGALITSPEWYLVTEMFVTEI